MKTSCVFISFRLVKGPKIFVIEGKIIERLKSEKHNKNNCFGLYYLLAVGYQKKARSIYIKAKKKL